MKVYCISGLGTDKRAFQYLDLDNLVHVEWIEPKQDESISNYSKRLSEQINTAEPFVLLGLSFGGIIACELTQILNPEKVILLSSISNKNNLPILFRLIGKSKIHTLIPHFLMKPPMPIAKWFFGISEKEHYDLLTEIFNDTDTKFIKWAVNRILDDVPIAIPKNSIRIHGTNDRLLPHQENVDYTIKDGGHFMVVNKSEEVEGILKKVI